MKKILIVSFANWDSLMELPFVFKSAGCSVDIFSRPKAWVLESSFYDKWIEAPASDDDFVKVLFKLVEDNGNDYFWIIPGDDIILRVLNDTIQSEALFHKVMPLSKIENRVLLGSKAGFSELCDKYGVETPKFMIWDDKKTIDEVDRYMTYPFMVKTDKSEAGTGVFKCDNKSELADTMAKIENKENVVFQQFIEGYDINMEVLFWKGQLVVYTYAKLLKILGNFGLSTQRLFCRNDDIQSELEKIGKSFGISGFASIAFMYSENEKKHYLIEVDIRPNSWIYYGRFSGNDFAEGIRRIISGNISVVKPDPAKFPAEVKISLYKKDMMRTIVKKDINGVLYWMLNKEDCRRFVPTYDKKLMKSTNGYLYWYFKELLKEKMQKVLGQKK